jgi:hypothetical protein
MAELQREGYWNSLTDKWKKDASWIHMTGATKAPAYAERV